MFRLNAPLYVFGYRIRVNAWLRDLRIAFRTLLGQTHSDHRLLYYVDNRADLTDALRERAEMMPQAVTRDATVTAAFHDDWRIRFASRLSGAGLELGALHRPLQRHDRMQVDYLDYETSDSLRKRYPHVADGIVEVSIVDDAETLASVADAKYDFLIAAHVIEHMRNPLGALREWLRVVKPGGAVYLIVPDKRVTFDKARVRTRIEHLILDYLEPSAERDFDHFVEYATLVNGARGSAAIEAAHRLVEEHVSIHYHVFMPADVVAMAAWLNEHVTRVHVEEGPAVSPEDDEFHLLLRKTG